MSELTRVYLPDLEDHAAKTAGMEALSFRGARDALGCEKSGLSLQSVAAGARQPFGHHHGQEEEIYLVLKGGGTMRAGTEDVALAPMDAVRVAPGVTRAIEAGPEGIEFVAFGSPGGGQADGEMLPGWWGD
jgi:mannose-6-phosphate isomerase-like protein (cupin superfamily)